MIRNLPLTVAALAFVSLDSSSRAQDRPIAERFLIAGDLDGGEKALDALLKEKPDDAQARFGLGTIQFVKAVAHLAQGFHRYGLAPQGGAAMLPFLRLPIPPNPAPAPISYDDLRAIMQALADDLAVAEATLAQVGDDSVKLPIRFGLVRMDLDGDGKAGEDETLWKLYSVLNRQVGRDGVTAEDAAGFDIAFDRGDVAWMRGYCHLLMAMDEFYLALDAKALFDHTAHQFFARPETPFPFLLADRDKEVGFDKATIGDAVAFVHLLRFPVRDRGKMQSVLTHLEAMIAFSHESWKFYLAETDDDREWIPNPKQSTVIPGVKVTDEMVQGWTDFLDEAGAILSGKLLVPFWRDAGGKGVNLRGAFAEPREIDAALWFQGTAAAPYLEEGPVTTPEVWQRLMRFFGGQFVGFALWFN